MIKILTRKQNFPNEILTIFFGLKKLKLQWEEKNTASTDKSLGFRISEKH
jgi:hypothetical protein